MARHKKDQRTERLLAEMSGSRADLRIVVDGLVAGGTKRREIAAAAEWNPGYLTEFLTNSEKQPTAQKVESLIGALGAFLASSNDHPQLIDALGRVADRYGVALVQVANPAVGPIPGVAPNYVRRPDVDDALARACAVNGSYAVHGQPMSGVSSTLLCAEGMLRERGFEVCHLSASTDLIASKAIEESNTGVLGALASAISRSKEPLSLEFYGVQDAIRAQLDAASGGFALIVDDVNALDDASIEGLKQLLRDWSTKRALGDPVFLKTTSWLASTSNVSNVRWRSHFVADYTVTRWFLRGEVRELAASLAPFAVAMGLVGAPSWATQAADTSWRLFGGQPHLSHCFLWDRHNDGSTEGGDILSKLPSGVYARHLDRLARSLVQLISETRAEALLESLSAGGVGPGITPAEQGVAEDLGILAPSGAWSCAYYKAHLARAVQRRGSTDGAASQS